MLLNNLKTGWRSLLRQRLYTFISIGGMAIGLSVTILIGLWVFDELSFNQYHKNYDSIGQIWSGKTDSKSMEVVGSLGIQYPVALTLKDKFPQFFKSVQLAWWSGDYTLIVGDRDFERRGEFIEDGVIDMLSLKMVMGTNEALQDPHSVILSQSTADALFPEGNAMGKLLRINAEKTFVDVSVTGVYEDIPFNSHFGEVDFFAPWQLLESSSPWIIASRDNWDNGSFNIYVQLNEGVNIANVNAAIGDLYLKNAPAGMEKVVAITKPYVQVLPMSTWHLYSQVVDGVPSSGRIVFVWLFGIIGAFVLLLACINFINLSTARSEKRSREVGIRKAIGSAKLQLITQFLTESLLTVSFAFFISVVLVIIALPYFNDIAGKRIAFPFGNIVFWLVCLTVILITTFIAGMYPAFYLSSFHPIKALRGTLHVGRLSALPRKILVVIQFTVAVVLVVGTLTVYRQVQFAQSRPVGYDRSSLLTVNMTDQIFKGKSELLRNELLNTNVVSEVAMSSTPLTAVWRTGNGYDWPGKDPNMEANFATCIVTPDFGKATGWKVIAGRDFSRDFRSDSLEAIIVNEAAVKYMGIADPVGKQFVNVDEFGRIKWTRTIIGVVENMVMESPYDPVRQTIYFQNPVALSVVHLKISPEASASRAISEIEATLKKVVPSAPFSYSFVDEEYAKKFQQEQQVGKLSGIFSILAIFISAIGLFGFSSFVTEQRTKEIGVRKILGASVLSLWRLLSKDFVLLVLISCLISLPVGYFVADSWLNKFEYRATVSWWMFIIVTAGALVITLATVTYHSLKAAVANPTKTLKAD